MSEKKQGSVNNQIFKVYSEACSNGVSFDTVLRSLSGTFGRGSRSEKSIQPCINLVQPTIDYKEISYLFITPFLTIFGLFLAMFLTSQPYDFDAIAHIRL